ncbi:hypothetical protein [[Acholeplasma] multilocale]|uniref:hypothetical protein n=1 Tax=[Acholeplasma] multilocale TaxID=264638 RepID=UPI00047959E4|nr:hypothetical protein [[Acholeplasma] multilocale]
MEQNKNLVDEIQECLSEYKYLPQDVTNINSINILGDQEAELVHFTANISLETKTTNVLAVYSKVFHKMIFIEWVD